AHREIDTLPLHDALPICGWNWAKYCNEELDAKAAEADAIVDPARAEERLALWRSIFLEIMEDAPWAPVFNEQRFTMHSERIGGRSEEHTSELQSRENLVC